MVYGPCVVTYQGHIYVVKYHDLWALWLIKVTNSISLHASITKCLHIVTYV